MPGVRPIEAIVQYALSGQALTVILYNCFCMAELLLQISKIASVKAFLFLYQLFAGIR